MIALYHRQITREALASVFSQDALAAVIAANLEQDHLAGQVGHPEFHFDDNAFTQGRSYMEEQRSLAVSTGLSSEGSRAALEAFGRLTHCAQDFYAHSNYVSLWVNLHPGLTPDAIDPLDPEVLAHPGLRSGRIYYPWELLGYVPILGRLFRYLLPRDAHAWMNLDSPASGPLFDFAHQAAIKRTMVEFNLLASLLVERGGAGWLSRFTGLDQPGMP
jgi:hypothetical protein